MTVFVFPGQGSQKLGMGQSLFAEFPELVSRADDILGYSIARLCIEDPNQELNNTQFTQVALYVVNALTYLKKINEGVKKPDYLVGHSLGEYNALLAAGVFNFETGLTLVQKRGCIMSQVNGGGMAAILGINSERVFEVLQQNEFHDLCIANYNSYSQIVISGPTHSIVNAQSYFMKAGAKLYLPLKVSGAFHSPFMNEVSLNFAKFIKEFTFSVPEVPVIANLDASPYPDQGIEAILSLQINHSVQWVQSIEFLRTQGETIFEEIGPGVVLTRLINQIQKGI